MPALHLTCRNDWQCDIRHIVLRHCSRSAQNNHSAIGQDGYRPERWRWRRWGESWCRLQPGAPGLPASPGGAWSRYTSAHFPSSAPTYATKITRIKRSGLLA
jgi:hypothetical protein